MCISVPAKVISQRDKKIIVERAGQREKINGSLVKVKAGDYVILQNDFIISKINKKEAKEILNLMHTNGANHSHVPIRIAVVRAERGRRRAIRILRKRPHELKNL